MAEIVGILAAASQLAIYGTNIVSLASEMKSDLLSGLQSVRDEIVQIEAFISIANSIRESQSRASVDVRKFIPIYQPHSSLKSLDRNFGLTALDLSHQELFGGCRSLEQYPRINSS